MHLTGFVGFRDSYYNYEDEMMMMTDCNTRTAMLPSSKSCESPAVGEYSTGASDRRVYVSTLEHVGEI